MCGIAGFFTLGGHDRQQAGEAVQRMADTLAHRGPDAEGFYVDDSVALGHRRLSIIDLSQGQQPMAVADGRLTIVFNGEIYNYPQIRKELEGLGHRFRTASDTEVIPRAYLQWGEECLSRLNGMFAFALWDRANRSLFLARDRVGKKPLYYHFDGKVFSFASELKALLRPGLIPRTINPQALDCYLTFGYVPAPLTIFAGVHKLRAAHSLTVVAGRQLAPRKYWDLCFVEDSSQKAEDAEAEFESLLDDAVRIRLMSEVPLGAFLSGGIDSTLVVSSMARLLSQPVKTNSIGFGNGDDELPVARIVAQALGTAHSEFVVNPDSKGILERIAWHFDEPFADSSAVPSWYVCEMARRNVTVALSGDGGDENFGGYTFRYLPHVFEARLRALLPLALRRPLFGLLGACYPASSRLPRPLRLKTILENLGRTDGEAFYHDLCWLRAETRASLYAPHFLSTLAGGTPWDLVRPLYETTLAQGPLNRSLYTDIHFYMSDDCLVKVDRMSMAHALEVRSPLLDYRLMEFAARLPVSLKLGVGKGKILLRRLAARRLPPEVLAQPKKGFSIPAAQWLRGELRERAREAILGRDSFPGTILLRPQLEKLWAEHQSGSRDHNVFLWGLMMLDLWARKHLAAGVDSGQS